ncbi:kremen protein 2 [Pelodytes ibericus]
MSGEVLCSLRQFLGSLMLLVLLDIVLGEEIPFSELAECFTVNGRDYRGSASLAGPERISCLYWNQTFQHMYNTQVDPTGELGLGPHNYCRNPDADVHPWCYVSETEEGIYWKYCDILACHMPGYVGCFHDHGSPPALSGVSATYPKLTVQICIRYCRRKGYQYAGMEAGYACFCGDNSDVSALQSASNSQCDHACFGRPNEQCGGDETISVYSVWVGACHGNLSSPSGVLYSPDFPEEYRPGKCSWDIRTPLSDAIELRFHSFHVVDPNDVLEMRDGESGGLLAQIRGGDSPPTIVRLPTGHLQVTFQADQRGSGPGYAITYRVWVYLASAACLLVFCIGYMIWRYISWCLVTRSPRVGVLSSSCFMLVSYRHKSERRSGLSCVNQSSMKSLL